MSDSEAGRRLASFGPNQLGRGKGSSVAGIILGQFKSPIVLILIAAAVISIFLADPTDAVIILIIVAASGVLGFWQERGASNAVQRLLALVRVDAQVRRGGRETEIPVEQVVPGDIVLLAAGDLVPGDCLILESKDLFVDEATLTGETYPVEKKEDVVAADTPLSGRHNALFMGTNVVSGSGTALVAHTGRATVFGGVSESLRSRQPETEFEQGVRRFGGLLLEVTLLLVIVIFAINVYLHRPVLDSFLFSLALAVGLTPQLLPAIISINLAQGAKRMAEHKVIVKRLASIENLGSMNVLCCDKTGTLTEGEVHLADSLDVYGHHSERVFLYGYLNAAFETGFHNPMDAAIRGFRTTDIGGYRKVDEVPYDFIRKRLSVVVEYDGHRILITKGTPGKVLEVCRSAEKSAADEARTQIGLDTVRGSVDVLAARLGSQGYRVLAVAYRELEEARPISRDDEKDLVFMGFLVFFDPPKQGIAETVGRLRALGVSVKMITGDNRLVAANLGGRVGLSSGRVLGGQELAGLSQEALVGRVKDIDIFAEVEPHEKERIVLAMRKAGFVVGYLGDGINDASALHAADVGVSVDTAVDVAKEAADFVLLEKDLAVLMRGVEEGRRTFANTLKYVFMATSANFGNMFSMAGASLFLSFLPLLPGQILLTNLLTDFPEMTIASDSVDPEMVERPRRWDIRFIRNFMMVFGVISSLFDFATFGVLILVLHAGTAQFRTGWFIESVASAALVVLVIRTRRPFVRSRPSRLLVSATLLVVAAVIVIPFTPLGALMGFVPVPMLFFVALALILVCYAVTAEVAKRLFYRSTR